MQEAPHHASHREENGSLAAIPIFDKATLVSRLMDDEEFAQKAVEVFLETIPTVIRDLRHSAEDLNFPELQRHAHSIKGASANIGAERLREVAAHIESAARNGNTEELLPLLPGLEREMGAFLSEARNSFA